MTAPLTNCIIPSRRAEMLQGEKERFMARALTLAAQAAAEGEVPVGAVIVHQDQVIAEGYNRKEKGAATHHAEILAIEEASRRLGRWRLTGCSLFVTLEPCLMCAGAIVSSRLDRVIYGAADPKAGAVESLYRCLEDERLNHQPQVIAGIMAEPASELLRRFFKERRQKPSATLD